MDSNEMAMTAGHHKNVNQGAKSTMLLMTNGESKWNWDVLLLLEDVICFLTPRGAQRQQQHQDRQGYRMGGNNSDKQMGRGRQGYIILSRSKRNQTTR